MKKYVFESLKFFCAAILCTILTAFATPSWGALPTGYTQLEYIESTGGQYIDTQYTMTNTSGIKIVIDDTATNSPRASTAAYFVGSALQGSYMGYFTRVSNNVVASVWAWNGENVLGNNITSTHSTVYINYMNDRKFIYNNGTRDYVREGDLPTLKDATGGLYLFNISSGGDIYRGVGKMYSAQITENQSIVRNLVPAQRNSDSAVGLYDTVNDVFYENKGTGSFIAGPEACDGTVVNYTSATGTGVQNGTPTPTNPIEPTFYKQGNMVLRKVGDYADTYDVTTGKITRRVGVKVFDGTEDWGYNSSTHVLGLQIRDTTPEKLNNFMITHFTKGGTLASNWGNCYSSNGYLGLSNANDVMTSLDQFKQWLAEQYAAGTPVTIYYPLAEETTEDWTETSYCEIPIKIATTKYNETKFSPLNAALANAISVVDSVVSNTITQAGRIATLQTQKQTRPADDTCPAYKQCLLVEDEQGVPHWYEITDPFRDFVAPIIANNVAPASTTNSAGYTQLEYIESTGTQYIDTGVTTPASNSTVTKFEANVAYTSSTSNQRNFIAGYKDFSHGHYCEFRNNQFGFSNGSIGYYSPTLTAETPYDVTMQINGSNNVQLGINIGGTDYTKTFTQYQADTMGQFVLFMLDSSYISKGLRMYSAKLTINNTLVRNMIPVVENTTGKIGMYDTVGGRFYGNAASSGDDFTPGPEVLNQNPDVPGMTWTATWTGGSDITAGTVNGIARCTSVAGTNDYSTTNPTKFSELNSTQQTNWNTAFNSSTLSDYKACWCKVDSVTPTSGNNISPMGATEWTFVRTRSDAAGCAQNCAYYCEHYSVSYAPFVKTMFGE